MKKTNKGFTLVELIIVIAVIGILAAILIPVFSNVIEKANRKSALSDAKNALQAYIAEMTDGSQNASGANSLKTNSEFKVVKGGKTYYFVYNGRGLVDATDSADADPAAYTPLTTGTVVDKNSYDFMGEVILTIPA